MSNEKPTNKPYRLVKVREVKGKKYFKDVGIAWPFKEKEGFNVQLDVLDAEFLLLPPKSGKTPEQEAK